MKKNIVIVHYNTPVVTEAEIKSILKHTEDCNITVFDNSDKYPLNAIDGVTILDNTHGDIIDFNKLINKYPERLLTANNHGSAKHIASVDYMFDVFPDGFLLMDSDVLIKKDISELFDDRFAWVGEIDRTPAIKTSYTRLFPHLLYINVPLVRKYGIRFWHESMVYKLSYSGTMFYDTGSSFLKDCNDKSLSGREISISEYAEHFVGCSCKYKPWKLWLDKNKELYEDKEHNTENMKTKDNKILVVIPFCSKGAQGRELEYAVAGWRRHFKENYLIVIAGEYHPVVETGDDIICVESKRVEPKEGMYRQHLDYVSCFRKVRAKFPDSDGFIFVADDCYAVNNFDLSDVKLLKQNGPSIESEIMGRLNGWFIDKRRTLDLLKKEGLPCRNFTTHLPQWFEWDKLEALWDKYDMDNNSYVMEDLYYNTYFADRIALQLNIDYDNMKCGVYRQNPRWGYIERALKNKIWIQNSVEGWTDRLDKFLASYYGI